MNIYVVRPGDSVWLIARNFGVTPESIIDANKLGSSPKLVVGQTLVIPSRERAYRVQPGDTIWSISRKFGVSPESIATLNNIQSPYTLYPGLVIRIPEKAKNYGYLEVNAFIQPSTPEKERRVLGEAIEYLTYVTPFSHHVTADGGVTPLDDDTILQVARDNKVATLMSVTNISGANFDTQLIDNILNNNQLQTTLINNILDIIKRKGYYGVVVDFERISPENREKYNNFLRKLVAALHPNYIVATALAPKTYDVTTGSWHGAHDYKSHGEIVDFVIIMTYEWGWSGGPPMAVAPINEVRKVINYAVSVIPPQKIMMGMPLYGYDWTLPYMPGGEFAESIGNQEAIDRAGRYGAIIKYDEKAQSPYYNYVDQKGNEHVVWFEDARSVEAKYKLASEYNLRGVSYWVLAQPFPQNWQVLDNMFNITKVIK
ncbi:LysM peptidoglycan-binding domain-containing protein [Clostridium lundense]|uniref:LysM peptidoglycan-binding domain-containing protein n=1 Tax=Clostridium lundense TaxID=319475 RepID=UPI0004843E0A|nr:glycoside hydrolase family 18 protein [Clostridium lundense]